MRKVHEGSMANPSTQETVSSNEDTPNKSYQESAPAIVCFHGSGESPLTGWNDFLDAARKKYTVVLLDRGTQQTALADANVALLKYLKQHQIQPPYILIAHSYGGAFAKLFLFEHRSIVAGMLLVETGQEGGLPDKIEKSILNGTLLDNKPLSVIRGNSLLARWKTLADGQAVADTETKKASLQQQRKWLEACDMEDERLKKAQLRISRNNRYVHLPNCRHHVIRDRPDIVLEELEWIMASLRPEVVSTSIWSKLKARWQATTIR